MPDDAVSIESAAAPNVAQAAAAAPPPPVVEALAETREQRADQRLKRQIDKALKGARAEKAASATPARGEGGKFAKKDGNAGKPEPGTAGEAGGAGGKPAAAPPPVTAGEPSLKRARELMAAGELDAAFEEAFGKKSHDFKIDSRRWEEWRKANVRGKERLEGERRAATEALTRDRRELEQTLDTARKELGPLLEGQKLFKAGDFAGALKTAFGVDVATFQRSLLAQHHGKNPEVEALRRDLAERDARDAERRAAEERTRAEASQREQRAQYVEQIRGEIVDGEDAELAGLATDPAFLEQVIQIQRQHYDPATRTTLPTLQAAAQVREMILARFGKILGRPRDTAVTVESAQPGSKAASSGARKATTSLPQRGAAEASAPGRKRSVNEMLADYTDRARSELGIA